MSVKTNQCGICGSRDTQLILEAHGTHGRHVLDSEHTFPIYQCRHCGVQFVGDVVVDQDYYQKYYESGYYADSNDATSLMRSVLGTLQAYSVRKKQRLMLNALKHRKAKYPILDVGCGSGDFLSRLDGSTFERFGVEINPEGAEICKKKGLQVYCQDLATIDFQGKRFDIITLWHVLEHLEDPVAFISVIHTLLEDDGILVLQTPNTAGWGAKKGKADWFHLDAPRHLHLFDENSLHYLLKKTNFSVVRVANEFYDYPLDLFWSIRNVPFRFLAYPLYPFFKMASKETLTVICRNHGNESL